MAVLETETALLATLLSKKSLYVKASQVLAEADFSMEYRPIYRLIGDYYTRYDKIDLSIIIDKSPDSIKNYIIELLEAMPNPSLIDDYIEIIKERSNKNYLIKLCESIIVYKDRANVKSGKLLNAIQSSLLKLVKRDTTSVESASDLSKDFKKRIVKKDNNIGLLTGYNIFDSYVKGFQKGRLYVIAANTGIGKSALAINYTQRISRKGKVMYYSLEMGSSEIYDRMVMSETGESLDKLSDENISDVTEYLSKSKFMIIDKPYLSTSDIYLRSSIEPDVELIVIDYLHLMNLEKGDTQALRIGNTTRMLKRYAKLLDIPIILISQFNRGMSYRDSKEPMLEDLKDSSSIEQDADCIIFLYKYQKESNELILKIAKNRNGVVGKILINFDPSLMIFKESVQ